MSTARAVLAVAVSFVIAAPSARAAQIDASSGARDAVQAAIDAAASGDTVVVPAGSWSWSSAVAIPATKGVTLGGVGATIAGAIHLEADATRGSRITGFTFTSASCVVIDGDKAAAPYRIDHCVFTTADSGATFVQVGGDGPGLIDHDAFTAPLNAEMIHNVGMGADDASGWSDDIQPGSWRAVYIEDCSFTNSGATGDPAYFWGNSALQSYYGARSVFRHNHLVMSQVDQHGTPGMIGARWWEIYANTFEIVQDGSQSSYIAIRAGSGVIFGNRHAGYPDAWDSGWITLYEEDAGYPALYQVGRGKDQALDPAYVWGNDAAMHVGSGSDNVVAGRDFFQAAKPGYAPFTYPYPLGADGLPAPEADGGGSTGAATGGATTGSTGGTGGTTTGSTSGTGGGTTGAVAGRGHHGCGAGAALVASAVAASFVRRRGRSI